MKNEINNHQKNEVSQQKPQQDEVIYALANIYRVFFARIFDLIISSIPGSLCALFLGNKIVGNWFGTTLNLSLGLVFIILYFVIIPSLLKGNTVGKLIFGIRLRKKGDKNKVRFYMLLAREAFFLLIPWAGALIFFVIALLILENSQPSNPDASGSQNNGAKIIYQLGYLFYLLWFLFLCISIKLQDQHQSIIDMKFGLYVFYKNPISKPEKQALKNEKDVLLRDDRHVSLTDMPGNFGSTAMSEVDNLEKKDKDNKNISFADLDKKTPKKGKKNFADLKELEDHQKEIEGDKDESN